MDAVRSLKGLTKHDKDLAGERAVDLALLGQSDFKLQPAFVILNEAFESFIEANGLRERIGETLAFKKPEESYAAIREMILAATFPSELVREIVDSYEGLAAAETSASALLEAESHPFVTVIISPNYTLPSEQNEGIILNRHGLEELLLAVKESWACLFTPAAQKFRTEAEIAARNLNTGVIVQASTKMKLTAEAWSALEGKQDELLVKAYLGAFDTRDEIAKDEWRFNREFLKPLSFKLAVQTEKLMLDENDNLGRAPIGEPGEKAKLDEREAIETARLAKKASGLLERHVKLVLDADGEQLTVLVCNRLLLTKGSVKLQGYEEEERIDETAQEVAELEPEESDGDDSIFSGMDQKS